jgi:hypothetical protein
MYLSGYGYYSYLITFGIGGVRMLKVDLRYLIYFARVVKKVRVDLEKLFYKTKHKKVDKIDPWSRWRERKKSFVSRRFFSFHFHFDGDDDENSLFICLQYSKTYK